MFLLALSALSVAAQAVDEYQVKAAFLYNFAKFVDWPAATFHSSKDPIEICIIGDDPFGPVLQAAINGKLVQGRPLVQRRIMVVKELGSCHILFVSSSERKRLQPIIEEAKGHSILTVGEIEGFISQGGVISFKVEDERVRFEINLAAAKRQKLELSAKLLSVAEIVNQ